MNKRPIQLWMSWISTIVLTPIIYITIALIWMSIYFGHQARDFDQKKWDENADLRYEMYSDLAEILIGLTKQEVEAMLSQEDPTIYDNDHWQIYMGYGAGLSVDLYYLDIYFENGKVAKVGRHGS